jgi:cytochrome c-type biogenesis protein CcmH/NrfF
LAALILFLLSLVPLAAVQTGSLQSARIERLEEKLLAPCCYTENLTRHRSEVALQMRKEITAWVAEGKSDREILDTYRARYGARVLAEPEGSTGVWLHAIPLAALLLGLLLVVGVLCKWRLLRPT